ncbi:MAG: hypothetical protein H7141_01080 [Burkholderiales bacterium]|nr:hypothetical protein [Bacteroidia bacterium]
MKVFYFVLAFVFCLNLFSQVKYTAVSDDFISFHDNISAAERMFKNDSLLQAYAKFDNAFSNYKGQVNAGHYFRAALCAIKIKEEFKALHFLEKAIYNGYEIDSAKKGAVVFYNQNTKKEYMVNAANWEKARYEALNSEWESELYNIKENNKKYAAVKYTSAIEFCCTCMKSKACSKTSPDYLSKYKLVKEKIKADSTTAADLLKKIQQYGFPSMKIVGKGANAIARNILLNYDSDKKNERLDNLLSKALLDGNISPEFYATLIDRRNLMSGITPEFYEPITGYEKSIGKEIVTANTKRRTIGLYPIKLLSGATPKSKDPNASKKVSAGLYDY